MSTELVFCIIFGSLAGIWWLVLMVREGTSPLGAINYFLIPCLVPLFCLWQEATFWPTHWPTYWPTTHWPIRGPTYRPSFWPYIQLVRRSIDKRLKWLYRKVISLNWASTTDITGSVEPYSWSYTREGNKLATFGLFHSIYDEERCRRWIFHSLPYFASVKILIFYLKKPYGLLKIKGIELMKASFKLRQNKISDDFDICLDPRKTVEFKKEDFLGLLKHCLRNACRSGYKILRIFSFQYEEFNNPSEAEISSAFFNVISSICDYFGLKCVPQRSLPVNGSPLVSEEEAAFNYRPIIPDQTIVNGRGEAVCVGEIKKPCIYSVNDRDSFTKDVLVEEEYVGLVKQLLLYMIAASVRFGYLFDGYFLILIEFDEDESYYQNEFGVLPDDQTDEEKKLPRFRIPSKTLILNVNSINPSFLVALIVFIYMAQRAKILTAVSPIFQYFKLAYQSASGNLFADGAQEPSVTSSYNRFIPSSSRSNLSNRHLGSNQTFPTTPDAYHNSATYSYTSQSDVYTTLDPAASSSATPPSISGSLLNVGDKSLKKSLGSETEARWLPNTDLHNSYVFEIQAKHLNDVILDPVLGNEMVIMNIYSPFAFWRRYNLSIEERQKLAHENYFNEKKAIEQLKGSQDYNNIYLEHKDVEIELTLRTHVGTITGNAIISQCIESDPVPQTLETYELAKRQLEIIHEAGVIHGSINKRNIVFAAGKIYLYNLNHSKLMKKYTSAERDEMIKADFRDLRSVFHELPPN